MSLRDIMKRDCRNILRNRRDFGEFCRLKLAGSETTMQICVVMAPSPIQQAQQDEGHVDERMSSALLDGEEYRAACWAIAGQDRGPAEGDQLLFETGEHAGTWVVNGRALPLPGDQFRAAVTWQALTSMGQQRGRA